jgi:hypothetical protein
MGRGYRLPPRTSSVRHPRLPEMDSLTILLVEKLRSEQPYGRNDFSISGDV